MNQPDFTPISKPACNPPARRNSTLATVTALALVLPLLSACAPKTTTLETPGLVTPEQTKPSCPTIAYVKPIDAPEPPPGISLQAIMTALGKDGWEWLWNYKQHSDSEHAQLSQIYKDCRDDSGKSGQ